MTSLLHQHREDTPTVHLLIRDRPERTELRVEGGNIWSRMNTHSSIESHNKYIPHP